MNKKKLNYRVTYLEMNRKPSFDWPKNLKHKLSILLAESFPAWYFLFFYKQVGKNYYWTDWLRKSEDEIDEFVNDKNVLLYTLIKDGWPVGFYMLDYRKKDICDLSFFGLVDEVIGIGLGKYLLQIQASSPLKQSSNFSYSSLDGLKNFLLLIFLRI